jgi:succinate-semialdehyde dehydrogenase / glutarate-semialdehyde dehydrogenase
VNAIVDRYFQVVAERLETGAVGDNINDTTELQALFGGWKLSGIGRELGPTR